MRKAAMTDNKELPSEAQVVVIGGGIIGCSIAYHLAKRGMSDVVLLERKQLTCGSTWHAPGLVSMLWPTPYLTNLAKYSHELYASLEAETGQGTGYRRIGSVSLARTHERLEELRRTSSMASVFGVESEMIDNQRLAELYPEVDPDGVLGALHIEKDGQTNPVDTTMAMAKGRGRSSDGSQDRTGLDRSRQGRVGRRALVTGHRRKNRRRSATLRL
jgi:4-methylaminobutanoate oxidase (formaldehyde-forming)